MQGDASFKSLRPAKLTTEQLNGAPAMPSFCNFSWFFNLRVAARFPTPELAYMGFAHASLDRPRKPKKRKPLKLAPLFNLQRQDPIKLYVQPDPCNTCFRPIVRPSGTSATLGLRIFFNGGFPLPQPQRNCHEGYWSHGFSRPGTKIMSRVSTLGTSPSTMHPASLKTYIVTCRRWPRYG